MIAAFSHYSLDVFITNVSVVLSLRITSQVIIELVEKNTGNKLRILRHGQLIRQLGHLSTHLQNLCQTWDGEFT